MNEKEMIRKLEILRKYPPSNLKDILDCIDDDNVIEIDKVMKKIIRNPDNRFQYMCLDDDPCDNQYEIDGTVYCTGNRKYEI